MSPRGTRNRGARSKREAERAAYLETTESLAHFANALRACLDLAPIAMHDGSRPKGE